jgi:serine acetyltransferase
LGRRVELSPGCVVVRGVSIGDDVWVGPNAVVHEDVPARSAVLTEPARLFGGIRDTSPRS